MELAAGKAEGPECSLQRRCKRYAIGEDDALPLAPLLRTAPDFHDVPAESLPATVHVPDGEEKLRDVSTGAALLVLRIVADAQLHPVGRWLQHGVELLRLKVGHGCREEQRLPSIDPRHVPAVSDLGNCALQAHRQIKHLVCFVQHHNSSETQGDLSAVDGVQKTPRSRANDVLVLSLDGPDLDGERLAAIHRERSHRAPRTLEQSRDALRSLDG
mmetsp:Transcript_21639/g.47866  ORF Transcript_21639/g.47866 Transcript_21639/m.47866 type:complete len:215 (+) Transcript_21639:474-1118(+)